MGNSQNQNGTKKLKKEEEGTYGILDSRNIDRVQLGDYEFDTWYGNAAYFSTQDHEHDQLGIDFMKNPTVPNGKTKGRKKSTDLNKSYWIDRLYVCEYCFKYTSDESKILQHRQACDMKKSFPPIGTLVYRDLVTPYIIKRVRGFKHPLFLQNLSLFGKLFLDDKSVYYHLDYFDFYIVYGYDPIDRKNPSDPKPNFKPMGFFSKEVITLDNDNNLNCICVFPPYQRLHLGSLLIEFLYSLAGLTRGQFRSGPEFPLSPYGKLTYLKFWSRKLSYVLASSNFKNSDKITLKHLSDITGFRCEDILMTLEHMKLLVKHPESENVELMLGNLENLNNGNPLEERCLLNKDCLLI